MTTPFIYRAPPAPPPPTANYANNQPRKKYKTNNNGAERYHRMQAQQTNNTVAYTQQSAPYHTQMQNLRQEQSQPYTQSMHNMHGMHRTYQLSQQTNYIPQHHSGHSISNTLERPTAANESFANTRQIPIYPSEHSVSSHRGQPDSKLPQLAQSSVSPLICHSCERVFDNMMQLQKHNQMHVMCPHPGCLQMIIPNIMTEHIKVNHSYEIQAELIRNCTDSETQNWIAERKKNWRSKIAGTTSEKCNEPPVPPVIKQEELGITEESDPDEAPEQLSSLKPILRAENSPRILGPPRKTEGRIQFYSMLINKDIYREKAYILQAIHHLVDHQFNSHSASLMPITDSSNTRRKETKAFSRGHGLTLAAYESSADESSHEELAGRSDAEMSDDSVQVDYDEDEVE